MSKATSSPDEAAASTASRQRRPSSGPLRGIRCETWSRVSVAARRPDRLLHRLRRARVAAPRVRRVDPAVPRAHPAQSSCSSSSVAPRSCAYSRPLEYPQAPSSRALLEEPLHLRQLVGSGRPVLQADDGEPELAVRHEAEHVDRRPGLLQPLEVAGGRRPGDGHRFGVAVDRARRAALVADREAAVSAVADHLERHALMDRR